MRKRSFFATLLTLFIALQAQAGEGGVVVGNGGGLAESRLARAFLQTQDFVVRALHQSKCRWTVNESLQLARIEAYGKTSTPGAPSLEFVPRLPDEARWSGSQNHVSVSLEALYPQAANGDTHPIGWNEALALAFEIQAHLLNEIDAADAYRIARKALQCQSTGWQTATISALALEGTAELHWRDERISWGSTPLALLVSDSSTTDDLSTELTAIAARHIFEKCLRTDAPQVRIIAVRTQAWGGTASPTVGIQFALSWACMPNTPATHFVQANAEVDFVYSTEGGYRRMSGLRP